MVTAYTLTLGGLLLFIPAGRSCPRSAWCCSARPGVGAVALALLSGLFILSYGVSQIVMVSSCARLGGPALSHGKGCGLSRHGGTRDGQT